ncbi:hypothetical protein CGLO_02869 [Colletotrichum gloeosporioides Cg-14]|uniref:Uncharacterized protein n=1 Tax=Colletotrichum gloeosporioides (strain Cg-14) TaxID=1237896 RepID=T0LZU5_COLGC|nr:hypothetical protein CGLO_02869 [Colletotrichum gloeosporioides Cg-14]
MKFAFAATLLLTAISGVAAVGWPSNAGYYHGAEGIVPPGPWDEPDARSKCKYSRGRQVGGGRRSRFHIRIKDFKGDAPSFCHRFWNDLRKWGLICTPNSFETWKPFCGMEEGDLAWRFENSIRCNEGMVASTFWEVTKNEWGGILCRDYAVDEQDGACAHCPLMSEPFWAHTIYDKFKDDKKDAKKNYEMDAKKSDEKNDEKDDEKNGKPDDDSADDLDEDLFDDSVDDLDEDFFDEDLFDENLFDEDLFDEDLFGEDLFGEDLFDDSANDVDGDLSDAFVNLDEDDEKEHEGLIGKEFEA